MGPSDLTGRGSDTNTDSQRRWGYEGRGPTGFRRRSASRGHVLHASHWFVFMSQVVTRRLPQAPTGPHMGGGGGWVDRLPRLGPPRK